jgi:hypothetical protein
VSNGRTAESQTSPSFTHAARRPGCCSRHFSASRCGWRKSGRRSNRKAITRAQAHG